MAKQLSARDMLNIWEHAFSRHPIDRALTILLYAGPHMTYEELSKLPIPERDAFLLKIYERTFGPSLRGFSTCPECSEHLEFEMSTKDLLSRHGEKSFCEEYYIDMPDKNLQMRFRFPNSLDLASVSHMREIEDARIALASACVTEAFCNGDILSTLNLTPEIIDIIEEHISECEPDAEIIFDIRCAVCGNQSQVPFDILVFLWKEITLHARLLLYEIHVLASAYGWGEGDILSMSPARRRYYFELVNS
jgi:hypothetical protein